MGRTTAHAGAATPGHPIEPARRERIALGTTAVVATADPAALDLAEQILVEELVAIDLACSRFRPDSELSQLNERAGAVIEISPLLTEAVEVALRSAERTDGAVDPTVGASLVGLGYDRDFAELRLHGAAGSWRGHPSVGWERVELDPERRLLRVPRGVRLDLGATAKALAADRTASRAARVTASGVLVNLGGDIAVAGGAPEGGWRIGIAAACTTRPADADRVVTIRSGGLASSGTSVRTWRQGRRPVHHIIDPATGDCAGRHWSLVSSVAESCVEANTASTAAVVWGAAAPARLEEMGIPARLVHAGGAVITIGGWPAEPGPGSSPVPISAAHPASRLRREA